jgi:hypothetical protein
MIIGVVKMFNQKRFEELVNEWYKYKDWPEKKEEDEYIKLLKGRMDFMILYNLGRSI